MDIIETKIFKLKISKAKRKVPTNICKISFLNKAVELINVPHIFDHSSVKPYLPTDIKFGDPTVLYWLIWPSGLKHFIIMNLFLIYIFQCLLKVTPFYHENVRALVL